MEKALVLAEGFDGTMENAREVWAPTLVGGETLHARWDVMKKHFLELSSQVTVPVP